jgi:hypothetical protein
MPPRKNRRYYSSNNLWHSNQHAAYFRLNSLKSCPKLLNIALDLLSALPLHILIHSLAFFD